MKISCWQFRSGLANGRNGGEMVNHLKSCSRCQNYLWSIERQVETLHHLEEVAFALGSGD